MTTDLDQVVAQVEELEERCNRGEVSSATFEQQATALWSEWINGATPEARVLAQVLASLGDPDSHQRVQQIWEKWLQEIRQEEG